MLLNPTAVADCLADAPLPWLGGLRASEFLRDYWQKKPLLVRNAFPDLATLLEPDELLELAETEEAESRVIVEDGAEPWEVRQGPFHSTVWRKLKGKKWTALVQAVDHYLPPLADLLDHFAFVPEWRIDDVMVSYAVPGGSVGAHFDQYDVFLLQGPGQRRWQLGEPCNDQTPRLEHAQLRLIADMPVTFDEILGPGDLLALSADHGCDPTWPGSDHTREHVPLLFGGAPAPIHCAFFRRPGSTPWSCWRRPEETTEQQLDDDEQTTGRAFTRTRKASLHKRRRRRFLFGRRRERRSRTRRRFRRQTGGHVRQRATAVAEGGVADRQHRDDAAARADDEIAERLRDGEARLAGDLQEAARDQIVEGARQGALEQGQRPYPLNVDAAHGHARSPRSYGLNSSTSTPARLDVDQRLNRRERAA